jgi:hypothetical protein
VVVQWFAPRPGTRTIGHLVFSTAGLVASEMLAPGPDPRLRFGRRLHDPTVDTSAMSRDPTQPQATTSATSVMVGRSPRGVPAGERGSNSAGLNLSQVSDDCRATWVSRCAAAWPGSAVSGRCRPLHACNPQQPTASIQHSISIAVQACGRRWIAWVRRCQPLPLRGAQPRVRRTAGWPQTQAAAALP